MNTLDADAQLSSNGSGAALFVDTCRVRADVFCEHGSILTRCLPTLQAARTRCKPRGFPVSTESAMASHPSAERLLAFAASATAGHRAPVVTWLDLRRRMGVSAAVLANWKRRGLSKEGAIAAEREFGCSVDYLLTGNHPELSPLALALARHLDRVADDVNTHEHAYAAAVAVIDAIAAKYTNMVAAQQHAQHE